MVHRSLSLLPLALATLLMVPLASLAQSPTIAPEIAEPDPVPAIPGPNLSPLNLNFIQDPNRKVATCPDSALQLASNLILTPETICQNGLTPPSLWWMQEQFEAQSSQYKKLVSTWLTYLPQDDRQGRVDLVVNLQRWSIMDYFNRYEFIQAFGGEASRAGYNTRVFNLRGEFLGAYTCAKQELVSSDPGILEGDAGVGGESGSVLNSDRCHIMINRVGRILHGDTDAIASPAGSTAGSTADPADPNADPTTGSTADPADPNAGSTAGSTAGSSIDPADSNTDPADPSPLNTDPPALSPGPRQPASP
ncbi:hypothetical protein [Prochlorothrix hollandica]|uniref:hypothetical protein n=1 Tax=Prochlorothrix hollandica TaxID=1223 RepID=UPI0033409EB1